MTTNGPNPATITLAEEDRVGSGVYFVLQGILSVLVGCGLPADSLLEDFQRRLAFFETTAHPTERLNPLRWAIKDVTEMKAVKEQIDRDLAAQPTSFSGAKH